MKQGGLILEACRGRSKKINGSQTRNPAAPKHTTKHKPPIPQQPGDRDYLMTACDETHSTR